MWRRIDKLRWDIFVHNTNKKLSEDDPGGLGI